MKRLLIILILIFISNIVVSQDTCLTKLEIVNIAKEMQSLRSQSELLDIYKIQNHDLENVISKQTSIIEIKDLEIKMLNEITNKFIANPKLKNSWLTSKETHFIAGVVVGGFTLYLGATIISMIRTGTN